MACQSCSSPASSFGGKNSKEKDRSPRASRSRMLSPRPSLMGARLRSPAMRRSPCPLIRLHDVTTWDPAPVRDQVQQGLEAFLDRRAAELAPLGPDAGRLIDEARTAVRGGKRFRAAFCHWGYRAVRPDVTDAAALARA